MRRSNSVPDREPLFLEIVDAAAQLHRGVEKRPAFQLQARTLLVSHQRKDMRRRAAHWSHSTNQPHETFNLFRNPCPIGAKILFQTNSAKERDDQVSRGFIIARLSTCSG